MDRESYRKANFRANVVIVVVSIAIIVTVKKYTKPEKKQRYF